MAWPRYPEDFDHVLAHVHQLSVEKIARAVRELEADAELSVSVSSLLGNVMVEADGEMSRIRVGKLFAEAPMPAQGSGGEGTEHLPRRLA